MKRLFCGGIHPADKKELTCESGLREIDPDYVVIPMSQHIGAPCQPLVKEGDYVRAGQKIGDHEGLCVPVHASVSGRVSAIKPMPHTNGTQVNAVVIENDHRYTFYEETKKSRDKGIEDGLDDSPEVLTRGELFGRIREAGIVGMGGATFPTNVKASSSQDKIDTLIINACECEPYITADDLFIRTYPEQVLKGIVLLANALHPKQVFLAIEENKKQAIFVLQKYLLEYPGIMLKVLPTRYPQGAEKQLIKSLTGREIPPGSLPSGVKCAVFNVTTAGAIYQAVYEKMPLIKRIVTVTGEGVQQPRNFLVPIGTPFQVLIDAAGGLKGENCRVIAGGPMMGRAQNTLEVPVIKGTGAILCLEEKEENRLQQRVTCIRCGSCLEVCPMNLQPLHLYRYEKAENMPLEKKTAMLEKLHVMDCLECGCCAYTCPGKIPLVEHIRQGKRIYKEGKQS